MQENAKRRAVITGIGVISPCGIGKERLLNYLKNGTSPAKICQIIPEKLLKNFKSKYACEVNDFCASDFARTKELKRMDKFTQFALAGAKLAIADSGIDIANHHNPEKIGISLGTAVGGLANAETEHEGFLHNNKISPSLAIRIFGGTAHGNLSIALGIRGKTNTNSNSCASGNVAIGEAKNWIEQGIADIVIAGSAETPISPMIFGAFDKIGVMASPNYAPDQACRSFDSERSGFIIGEGATLFIIESLENAKKRNARIYAEIKSYSILAEAWHMCSPEPSGESITQAITSCLQSAKVNCEQIDYINAHASSTPQNDANEAKAIKKAFSALGDKVKNLPIISGTKAITGHQLGAAGAVESAICLLAMQNNFAPPTPNLERIDEDCKGLNILAKEAIECNIDFALNNSFGFGGVNTCLLFAKT